MAKILHLENEKIIELRPKPPYNFNANFHKPSHFPSSDNIWEEDRHWITMIWKGKLLGLKFENTGTVDKPRIKLTIFSLEKLTENYLWNLVPEIKWRFNFESDISGFYNKYKEDEVIGKIIKRWKGMKPVAANSLYESLMIYLVLQNATISRSIQMLENLFDSFGNNVMFDEKVLSTFWEPSKLITSSEQELRDLKVGYRAKYFLKISEQFSKREIDEFVLREMNEEGIKKETSKLYGIGPASIEYLLFEDFYFYDTLDTIPPWEQKIISRLIFDKGIVPSEEIIRFFKIRYAGWSKLAFHYIWEDLFWQRRRKYIEWLEKEIRRGKAEQG